MLEYPSARCVHLDQSQCLSASIVQKERRHAGLLESPATPEDRLWQAKINRAKKFMQHLRFAMVTI
ncbi:hypothetical protein CO611_07775 [Lysobacteraceae bacterium NML03-0222]|nr:hypothetical protein CO611_07775 [Xanthomonadaceae bacterium NML03-0222]